MAHITFRGGTKEEKKYARSLAEFVLNKLVSRRLNNLLEIRINFVETLHEKTESYGETAYFEDSAVPPREFVIDLYSKLKLRSLLETLAHELVHVKQWATGEMRETRNPFFTKYRKALVNSNKTDYWDQPWEIEAIGREEGLFIQWVEANKSTIGKLSWVKRKYT